MSKFVIECPNCGKFAEARTGFFAKRKIDCHENINELSDKTKVEEFSCAQCGVKLIAAKNARTYTCPVCDCVNDVQKQIAQEKIKKDGLASIIKYEGNNNTFVWKHPIEDFNLGSQLIVHESQEAIFFRDGQALDLFGAGRYTLETQQMPILEQLYRLPTDTDGTFHSEVYFINKTVQMAIKWGTPDKVRFIDPLTGVPLELGASGEMNISVCNSRKLLLKLVGTMNGISWDDDTTGVSKSLKNSFRPLISSVVKTNLPSVIKSNNIDILEIDEKLDIIAASLNEKIKMNFEDYGLTINQFYVTNVVLPEDDPNFKRIRELHLIQLKKQIISSQTDIEVTKAQNETIYRTEQERSKAAIEEARRGAVIQQQLTETEVAKRQAERRVIEAQAEAQAQRLKGLTEAEIMKAKGYSEKDVLQAEVQKAYAEGIGNMQFNGGTGSSIAGDIMGLGVGLAAASQLTPQIGGILGGMNFGTQPQVALTTSPTADIWNCTCGNNDISGKFCNMCGAKKPEKETWDCDCGNKDIIGKFCNMCGKPKPKKETWDCDCGNKNIIGNFCNNCGKRKGE